MVIKNRYDFVMLFDVETEIRTGDPDAGNNQEWMRRQDMDT